MNQTKRQSPKAPPPPGAAPAYYLLTSLFLSGACSLALEVVGTRLISPFYGSSIYTWSALITTTLLALAIGYAWGGRVADRTPYLLLFSKLLLGAGLTIAAVPLLRERVLGATEPLGVKLGALVAAAILVGPSLLLLGTLGPVATRLTATGAADAGRRAGDAWAVSTAGSVVGAALTGFVLVPLWPVSRILLGCAAALIALGAWGTWLSSRRVPVAQLTTCAACVVFAIRAQARPHPFVKERVESAYGRIEVLDSGAKRYLLVNGTAQSAMDPRTGLSDSDYDRALEWLRVLRPRARRVLALGLGAGLLPTALEREGLVVDVYEIDPEIVRVARKWFGYEPKGEVTVGDARALLETKDGGPWDFMVLDAFGAESPPAHLFTKESFEKMRGAMAPDGVLAVNLVTAVEGPDGDGWRAAYKTLRRVFPSVRAFEAAKPTDGLANVLLFASMGPLDAPAKDVPGAASEPDWGPPMAAMLAHELKPSSAELDDVPAMTDDHAPLDSLLADSAARWRGLLQSGMSEVMLR
ncbi:MAG TPA: fused MFS/spermidine synthase [Elusimicrobiota bacterium]|nr:fused MFS/spermidine synthase [Elusimicrobiota bacterium]